MLSKRWILGKVAVVAIAMIAMSAGNAQASILSGLLTFDGTVNTLEDDSRGLVINRDGSTLGAGNPLGQPATDESFTVGDIIYGMVRINQRSNPTPSAALDDSKQLIVVYSLELASFTTVGTGTLLDPFRLVASFVPTDSTHAKSIKGLMADAIEPGSVDFTKSAFAIFEQTFGTAVPANNPVTNTVTAGDTLITNITGNTMGWTLQAIAGLVSSSDFYQVQATNVTSSLDITYLRAQTDVAAYGQVAAGATIQYHTLGAGTIFLPVSTPRFTSGGPTTHDLTAAGFVQHNPSANFDFRDNVDFQINATPEPASIVVWSVLAGAIGLAAYRRRRS